MRGVAPPNSSSVFSKASRTGSSSLKKNSWSGFTASCGIPHTPKARIPTEITIYEDRTFDFILKTPPTSTLLREKAGLDKAAHNPGSETAGSITEAQLAEIAEIKMPDLNAYDLEAAKLQVRGTARSMGIEVV